MGTCRTGDLLNYFLSVSASSCNNILAMTMRQLKEALNMEPVSVLHSRVWAVQAGRAAGERSLECVPAETREGCGSSLLMVDWGL